MGLTIGFRIGSEVEEADSFSIVEEEGVFVLPILVLTPTPENPPHICKCELDFHSATPGSLLTRELEQQFNLPDLDPPRLLGERKEIPRQVDVANWPAEVEFSVRIKAHYYDSDGHGQPIMEVPKSASAMATWVFRRTTSPEAPSSPATGPAEAQDPAFKPFPGYVAVDFGTSNSTVTLYDPKRVQQVVGLPPEQARKLRNLGLRWLEGPLDDTHHDPGHHSELDDAWRAHLDETGATLEGGTGLETLTAPFRADDLQAEVHSMLRIVEKGLSRADERLRRAALTQLHHLYESVFRIPPLSSLNLYPAVLDEATGEAELSSESKIVDLSPRIAMGNPVRHERLQALRANKPNVAKQYMQSVKRFLGTEDAVDVSTGEETATVHADLLLQAAWSHLLGLTDEYRARHPQKFSAGDVETAIITYPTIAPPAVRKKIESLIGRAGLESPGKPIAGLGVRHVITKYDEAVSSAIFFLMQEAGGELGKGVEALKTRCRKEGGRWFQNMLVFDIGGGTTDIALIRLMLEDKTPPMNDAERGAGGHYYQLTPWLLGSSGHMQLGGDLITLCTFYLLKTAIADHVLAVASDESAGGPLQSSLQSLPPEFKDDQDRFIRGSLLRQVTQQGLVFESVDDPRSAAALAKELVEQILPTRWKDDPRRLQPFYTLWTYAEKAKIQLGRRLGVGEDAIPFDLSANEVQDLMRQVGLELPDNAALAMAVTREQFDLVASPVIREAVGIARGLVENRLPPVSDEKREPLEWLILSGKTCNLALVDQEVRHELGSLDSYTWSPENVTFDETYCKLSTSIGACYAEQLWRLSFDPEGAKPELRKGLSQVFFDIRNLYYFLPCGFTRRTQGTAGSNTRPIFSAGTKLLRIDGQEIGKARSEWEAATLDITVYRKDFDGGNQPLWGHFNGTIFVNELGIPEQQWEEQIKVQFEVDQQLQMRLLLCKGTPHYCIDAGAATLEVTEVMGPGGIRRPTGQIAVLAQEISVRVNQPGVLPIAGGETVVFKGDQELTQVFHCADGTQIQGWISEPLPEFHLSGKHEFYVRDAAGDLLRLGELGCEAHNSSYPVEYRASLDETGALRLHVGEVPYWSSSDRTVLSTHPGCVIDIDLATEPAELKESRNPFSGVH